MGTRHPAGGDGSGSTKDELDEFPCEEANIDEGDFTDVDAFRYGDFDHLERARADDSPARLRLAAPAATTLYAVPAPEAADGADEPLRPTVLLPARTRTSIVPWTALLTLAAAVGWGAFVFEKTRPVVTENPAVTAVVPSAAIPSSARDPVPEPTAPAAAAAVTTPAPMARPPLSATPPSAPTTTPTTSAPADAASPPAVAATPPPAATRKAPTDARARTAAAKPVANPPRRPPVAAVERPARSNPAISSPPEAAAAAVDLTGNWILARDVDSSDYGALTGKRYTYELALRHDGSRIRGTGRRVSEDGQPVKADVDAPISVLGTWKGDRATLTFNEGLRAHRRAGTFVLTLERPDQLRGRFSSNAANSKGSVELRRQ